MIFPFEIFLLGVVFFAGMGVINSVKAYQKKEREYYFSSLVSFLVVIVCALLFLEQILISFVLMGIVFVISIWRLPRILRIVDQELRKIDLSSSLKIKDFFSYVGWVKLANVWGLRKAVCIYFLFSSTFIGGSLYAMYAIYGIMSMLYVITYPITYSIVSSLMFYQQLKRLKQ
jgi:hypothetical protein